MRILVLMMVWVGVVEAQGKVVICGVAKDVADTIEYTVENIEKLGAVFDDYRVAIYENNSQDLTPMLLECWAEENERVHVKCEVVEKLATARTERISEARNKVLEMALGWDYDWLVMADLDFTCEWPIEEIKRCTERDDWDCVSANGIDGLGFYVDKYALRSKEMPFGPELLGFEWWQMMGEKYFEIKGEEWVPVYSAFGGLAIYRMESLKGCKYSGSTTPEMKQMYRKIMGEMDWDHVYWQMYLAKLHKEGKPGELPVVFTYNTSWEHASNHLLVTCCEHVGLHAAMHKKGCGRFFVNPKMIMKY